jgi:hypothetical protein
MNFGFGGKRLGCMRMSSRIRACVRVPCVGVRIRTKFTVKVHRELAQMLAERGDFVQAATATAVALRRIRLVSTALQDLINSSLRPSAQGAETAKPLCQTSSMRWCLLRLCEPNRRRSWAILRNNTRMLQRAESRGRFHALQYVILVAHRSALLSACDLEISKSGSRNVVLAPTGHRS